jgi:hypothetical protein
MVTGFLLPERRQVRLGGHRVQNGQQPLSERARRQSAEGIENPAARWTQPGLVGKVKHLRGVEELRHATLTDIQDD